jgi:hypothetical protein
MKSLILHQASIENIAADSSGTASITDINTPFVMTGISLTNDPDLSSQIEISSKKMFGSDFVKNELINAVFSKNEQLPELVIAAGSKILFKSQNAAGADTITSEIIIYGYEVN